MERKKTITRFTMITTLLVLTFCMFPIVQSRTPPFIEELPSYNNLTRPFWLGGYIEDPPESGIYIYIYGEWEFDSTEELYFKMGVARSIEEKENDWWPKPPYRYRLYINNEEINLQRYAEKGDKEILSPSVIFRWYTLFEPNYFEAGEDYLLRFELWVKSPYQGDGLNHWRIFVDYWGIYGPAGAEFSHEYSLNIV